jgi:hypothetical protein
MRQTRDVPRYVAALSTRLMEKKSIHRKNRAVPSTPARDVRPDGRTERDGAPEARQRSACGSHLIDLAQTLPTLVRPFAERQQINGSGLSMLTQFPHHLDISGNR